VKSEMMNDPGADATCSQHTRQPTGDGGSNYPKSPARGMQDMDRSTLRGPWGRL
jgi:hypothetical protein